MRGEEIFLRISSKRIAFLRFLLEGYDGLALLSTVDAGQGLVKCVFPRENYQELLALLAAISPDLVDQAGAPEFEISN